MPNLVCVALLGNSFGKFLRVYLESADECCLKEPTMTSLSLEEVLELLGTEKALYEEWHRERLCKWIEGLVEARGKEYVREKWRDLPAQWEQHYKGKFKSCL